MLLFLPTLPDLAEAGFAIILFLALAVVGAAAGGRDRRREFDPLIGWAILCLPFVLLGTLSTVSFFWINGVCVAIVAASLARCWRSRIAVGIGGWFSYLALALPFLVLVSPTDTYGWDQLSHWLPNADYIVTFQHFPREGWPQSTSAHAGYPYGFALAIYWIETAARLTGVATKAVGISATLNVLLFAVAARMLVEKVRDLQETTAGESRAPLGEILLTESSWLAAGLSLLLMTALSPTFLPTNSISASADNATSIALLAIAFAIVPGRRMGEQGYAAFLIQLASLLTLSVFLKEDDAVPALALLAGRLVWDFAADNHPLRTLRGFALASIPMLCVALLWHSYVYFHIPQGEMTVRPPSEWRFDLLPRVAAGMILAVISKIGFFVCLAFTSAFAVRRLWHKANGGDVSGAFAVVAAAGFIGYNLFLLFAYVSIFSAAEAERQAAVWRYETHLGLVLECAVILLAAGLSVHRRPIYGRLAIPVAAAMVILPIVFAPVIRPDLDPQYSALRAIGNDVSPYLAGAKDIYVIDQLGNGAPCPMIVYEAKTPVRLAECVTKISPCQTCLIQTAARAGQFIWSNGWSPALGKSTGLSLPANASYLLRRASGRWTVVARWARTPTRMRGVRTIWQGS